LDPPPTPALRARLATSITGRASEVVSPSGAVVQFSLSLQRGPLRRLRVTLEGQALPGGGISLSRGRVVLGTDTNPTLYAGPVSALQGGQLRSALSGPGTKRLALSLRMQIDRVSNRVTGAATLSPSRAAG
jgi:hypothetical protein